MGSMGISCAKVLTRTVNTLVDIKGGSYPRDFALLPTFFTSHEQQTLLATALQKLDSTESRHARRRRKQVSESFGRTFGQLTSLQNLFYPDEYYEFEEGHYDGVIHNFREMHVTSWPEATTPGLASILERLHALCPTKDIQTHLLHLASYGEILPHIDNISASGSWILGVSLGAERIMRMESVAGRDAFDVLLPSGSVYLQKDIVRFYQPHSILKEGMFGGRMIHGGQRLSIVIRDRLQISPSK